MASTGNAQLAIVLSEITTIRLGSADYEVVPYMKPPPNICHGVIHGLEEDTTQETLQKLLEANRPLLLHARSAHGTHHICPPGIQWHQGPLLRWAAFSIAADPTAASPRFVNSAVTSVIAKTSAPTWTHPSVPAVTPPTPPQHDCKPTCKLCQQPASRSTQNESCPHQLRNG